VRRALCRAALVAALVLAACGGGRRVRPASPDPELARRIEAARAAYEQGLDAEAARQYGRAASYAYRRDDLPGAASAESNRAVCLMRLGRHDEAAAALDRAVHARRLDGRPPGPDLVLLQAKLAYETGERDTARARAEEVAADPTAEPPWRVAAHAIRGLVAADGEDVAAARRALAAMGSPTTDHGRAEQALLAGRIALLEGRTADAAANFDGEAGHRRASLAYLSMARALARAGAAHEELDRPGPAARRFLRAGRSAAEQDLPDLASPWLQRAEKLADKAGDATTAAAARRWLDRIPSDDAGE